jgi:hypothetical protein
MITTTNLHGEVGEQTGELLIYNSLVRSSAIQDDAYHNLVSLFGK